MFIGYILLIFTFKNSMALSSFEIIFKFFKDSKMVSSIPPLMKKDERKILIKKNTEGKKKIFIPKINRLQSCLEIISIFLYFYISIY